MFRSKLFTGPLLEAAGEASGSAPAPAAPAATPPPATQAAATDPAAVPSKPSDNIRALIAARKAQGTQPSAGAPAQGQQAAAPPAATQAAPAVSQQPVGEPSNDNAAKAAQSKEPPKEAKRIPKDVPERPQGLADRLKIKAQRQAQQAQEQAQQSELARQLETTRSELELTKSASLKFRQAMDGGDYDAALKAIGVEGGVEGFTRGYLEKKAALPKTDPKVSELETRLAEYEKREQEREQARQQQEYQRQQQEQAQAELQSLAQEAKSSGDDELVGAIAVEGFLPLTRSLLHRHMPDIEAGRLTMEDVWGMSYGSYQKLFDQMMAAGFKSSVRGSNPEPADTRENTVPDRSAVLSAQPGTTRQPASHFSPANASEPVAQRLASGSEFDSDLARRREAGRQRFKR